MGTDGQRRRVHSGTRESPRTSSQNVYPSAFSILLHRLPIGGSIDSDSSSSAPQSTWELASFFCHYISKMTLFSNPAKADKYHQPVTSYISNSNIAASKSFYISISFAGSGRQPLILPRCSNAAFAHRGYSQPEQQVIPYSLSSSAARVLGNLDPISPYLAQE